MEAFDTEGKKCLVIICCLFMSGGRGGEANLGLEIVGWEIVVNPSGGHFPWRGYHSYSFLPKPGDPSVSSPPIMSEERPLLLGS